jgi:hypothetical protein
MATVAATVTAMATVAAALAMLRGCHYKRGQEG